MSISSTSPLSPYVPDVTLGSVNNAAKSAIGITETALNSALAPLQNSNSAPMSVADLEDMQFALTNSQIAPQATSAMTSDLSQTMKGITNKLNGV
ncbi:MAG TPA: hypothetical protein VK832_11050 [Burkholderiaceae bacterium]|jgi:hypothetical protein|nr:hypothetical protein [Burkholderiaceae bacterium]